MKELPCFSPISLFPSIFVQVHMIKPTYDCLTGIWPIITNNFRSAIEMILGSASFTRFALSFESQNELSVLSLYFTYVTYGSCGLCLWLCIWTSQHIWIVPGSNVYYFSQVSLNRLASIQYWETILRSDKTFIYNISTTPYKVSGNRSSQKMTKIWLQK